MTVDRPVGKRDDVGVVKGAVGGAFNPSGANGDSVALRQLTQPLCTWTRGNGFRQGAQLVNRQLADEPVSADTTLREHYELRSLRGRFCYKALDLREVGLPVAVAVLHLHTGNPQFECGRHLSPFYIWSLT